MFISIVFYFFLLTKPVTVHDFHVSKLDMHYNHKTNVLELTLHVFLDDLEKAMNQSGYTLNVIGTTETVESDQLITNYFKKKINIYVDNNLTSFHLIGKEKTGINDATYFYFEAPDICQASIILVENQLFHEIFDDQKNIISMTFQNKLIAFTILNKNNISHKISL